MNLLRLLQSAKAIHGKSPLLDETALTTEVDQKLTIAKWIDWINDSQQYHMNEVLQSAEEYFGTLKTIPIVAGTQEYNLQGNELQLRLIERTDTDPDRVIHPIPINDRLLYEPRYSDWNIFRLPQFSYIWNNQIGIAPKPTTSGTMQVLYIRRLPDLMYGVVAGLSATTLTFPATPTFGRLSNEDDYYNGATVKIISGTGAGQKREITDYVGSTRVATVAAWTTNPDTSSVYEIVCDVPEQHQMPIYVYAAILAKISDSEDPGSLASLHGDLKKQMTEGLTPRQTQGPRQTNYVEDEGYDF